MDNITTCEIRITTNIDERSTEIELIRNGHVSYSQSFLLDDKALENGGIGGYTYQVHDKIRTLMRAIARQWGGDIPESRHPGLAKPE